MRRLSRAAWVGIALAVVGCFRDSTSPRFLHPAAFSIAPSFSTRAAKVVEFDHVRVVLRRSSGAVALDTTVEFPDTSDQISLNLSVPLSGASGSETFALSLAMTEGADTVFRGGPMPVTVSLGVTAASALVPLRYTGVGANAASVAITVKDTCLFFADSVMLTAIAKDSAGRPIPGTPIEWETLDSARVRLPSAAAGKVLALSQRGVARVIAETPTGLADTSRVTVQPAPAALSVVSGGNQWAAVGSALAQPVVLRAKAADSLGVRGVAVSLTVAGGGSVLKATDTTNASGDVSVPWTLGTVLGPQSITARVASAPGIAATVTATGVAGAPKKLAFKVEPAGGAAGVALSPAVQVVAQDTFGNVVTGYTGSVTIALGANPGGATLGGTLTAAAAAGVASFADLTLNQPGAGYTLVASAAGLAGATSTGFDVSGGVPAQLAFVQQPTSAVAGAAITPPITVAVLDASGNTVTTATNAVTLAIGTNPAGGTLGGTLTVNAAGGVATFSNLTINRSGAGYTLTAGASGLTSATSGGFSITAGAAGGSAFTTEPSASVVAGTGFGVTVTVLDAQGNTVTGFTGNVALAITGGTGKAGAALHGTTTVAASAGVATFAGLSIDSAGTGYTLTATATGATSATSTAFTVNAGAAASLAFTTQPPATSLALAPFAFGVSAKDATGNVATGFGGSVTVAIGTNPVGGTLSGTLTQNAVNGVATFSGVSIDNIGAGYTLVASASSLTSATSASFAITSALNANAWINGAGGNWSVAANWSKGTVPVATDTVQIKQAGTYTVTVDGVATFARLDVGAPSGTQTLAVTTGTLGGGNGAFGTNTVLNLSGSGTIGGAGTLNSTGAFNWTGGSLNGSGGTLRVAGPVSIAPAGTVSFAQYTLEVAGTGTWTGTGQLYGGQAILRVASGGTLDIQGDPSLAFNTYWAWAPRLNVAGTLTRTTSTGVAAIGGPLNDSGTVSLQSGTLRLSGGGTSTGKYQVGAGDMDIDFSGGTLTFDGTEGPIGALTVQGGTLGGSGLVTVGGQLTWTGGNLSGANGTVRAAGALSIAPTGTVNFAQYTLEVAGTGTWTGTSQIYGGQAIIRVASGGTLDIQGDPSLAFNAYWAWAPRLNVAGGGTLNRTTSTGVAAIGGPLNDSGTVNVQSGSLQLTGGGTSTGAYQVATGGVLDFNSGTHTLAAGSNVTGAGLVMFSGGTVTAAGGYGVTGPSLVNGGTANFNTVSGSAGSLTVTSGTLGGTDTLTVTGPMSWAGGNLSGANGKVRAAGTLSLAPTGTVNFAQYTLEVAGTGTWTGTGQLYGGQAILRVASGGTLDIQGNSTLAFNAYWAWAPRLNVVGTLNRTTGTGVASIGGPLNDSGMVRIQSGTLRLGAGGTSTGAFQVVDPGTLEFSGGTHTLEAASRIAGYGTVSFSGGTAALNGTYAVGGPALIAGGTANFNDLRDTTGSLTVSAGTLGGSGLLVVLGPMSWTGGNLSGSGGTVRVWSGPGGTLSLAPAGTVNFAQYTLELAGTGTWTGTGQLYGGQAILRVTGGATLDIQGDPSLTFNAYWAWAPRLNVVGTLTRSTSTGVATIGGPLNDSGTVSVQSGTLRMAGGGAGNASYTVSTGATLDLASGTWTVGTNMPSSFAGSLTVSSGSLVLNGNHVSVGQNFATAGSGALVMNSPTDSLGVRRNVIFGGGAGTLTSGLISVGRNFTQTGAGNRFAPTGTVVAFTGDSSLQAVQFADSANNSFYALQASPSAWDTVRLLSDVTVRNNLTSGGHVEVVSASTQRLRVNGLLHMPLEGDRLGYVHPLALELLNPPSLDAGYYSTALSPDTLVFLGAGGYALPNDNRIQYNSVRIAAGSPITWNCSECSDILGDVVIGGAGSTYGGFQVASGILNIDGKLKTQGQGVLMMPAASWVYVGDSAIFAGGSTAGLLTDGNLELYGDLAATAAPGAFAPSENHVTDFTGDVPQTVYFASPGTTATSSHFNMLYASNWMGGLHFLSSAHALSDVNIESEGGLPVSGHSGDSLTAFGSLYLAGVRFDSLSFVAKLPQSASVGVNNVTFGNYDPSVTEFYFEQPGDPLGQPVMLYAITFLTDLPTGSTGWHFVGNDADGVDPFLQVNLYASFPPPSYNAAVDQRNGAIVRWAF